jgi:D-alanyl-D-alanine carboxypeptidase
MGTLSLPWWSQRHSGATAAVRAHARSRVSMLVAVVVSGVLAASSCTGASAPGSVSGTASPGTVTTRALAMAGAQAAVRTAISSYFGDTAGVIALIRVGPDTKVVAHGLADMSAKRPLTADVRFPVASITKSMVAAAVLDYVAEGRLSLDDPVDRYLPGVVPSGEITVRHLLSHRSGLPELIRGEWDTAGSHQAALRLATGRPLDFEPGANGSYSNPGYLVLGLLLEKLSGKALARVLDERVFTPAGMTSSSLAGEVTAVGYTDYPANQVAARPPLDVVWAAGGVVSTVSDVDRFYTHLLAGDLVPRNLLSEMEHPAGPEAFGFGQYGLGLWLPDRPCGKAVGHGGSIEGFETAAWSMTSGARSVVVMADVNTPFVEHIADAALCG